jgi:hypothetical protein
MTAAPPSATRPTIAPADAVMICAMLASGVIAAVITEPALWLVTPLMAFMALEASKRARTPLTRVEPRVSELPPRIELVVRDSIKRLPAGDAQRLLADIVREARPLFATRSSSFDAASDDAARTQAGELVLASCDTALELARLDALLAPFQDHTTSTTPARNDNLLKRYATARDLFAARLTDAAGALGALYAAGVEHGTPASDRVAELVTDLKADAAARSSAKSELDELLSPRSPSDQH